MSHKEKINRVTSETTNSNYVFLDKNFLIIPKETSDFLTHTYSLMNDLMIKEVLITSELSGESTLDDNSTESESLLPFQNSEDQQAMIATLDEMQTIGRAYVSMLQDITKNTGLSSDRAIQIIHRIHQVIRIHKKHILRLEYLAIPQNTSDQFQYIAEQAIKTTIVATIIASHLKFSSPRLVDLSVTALLHSSGMIQIPKEYYMSNTGNRKEIEHFMSIYPYISGKIAVSCGFSETISDAILQCRENLDGSGYPKHLKKDQISSYAKIISVCSAYAAMLSDRPHREKMDGHSAMSTLIKARERKYDSSVIRVLLQILSLYPPGTIVELANKQIGMVVDTVPHRISHPIVQIYEKNGTPVRRKVEVGTHLEKYRIVGSLPIDAYLRMKNKYFPEVMTRLHHLKNSK